MINLDIRYFYIGNGAYMFGIPARDLTTRDLLIFEIDEKVVEKSGLYRKNEQVEKESIKKESPKRKVKYGRS